LAEVHLARERDLGYNDTQFITITHLGHLLKAGDYTQGYDLTSINFNDADTKSLRGRTLPDVVLCRKAYVDYRAKKKRRKWRVANLTVEADLAARKSDLEKADRDREHFLEDLEEDPELWKQVNLYQDEDASSTLSDSEVEDFPGPRVNDLIRGMEEMHVDDMEMDD